MTMTDRSMVITSITSHGLSLLKDIYRTWSKGKVCHPSLSRKRTTLNKRVSSVVVCLLVSYFLLQLDLHNICLLKECPI